MKTKIKRPTMNITEAEKLLAETHNLPVKRMENQLLISFPKEKPAPVYVGKRFRAYSCGNGTAKIELKTTFGWVHLKAVKDMHAAMILMQTLK